MIIVLPQLFHRNYVGLSLWPFIFLRYLHLKEDAVLINHERIHLRQQRELLLLPFYIFYFLEWLLRCCKYGNGYKAYLNLSFEREAYAHEKDMDYLDSRPSFGFLKYLWVRK